ncbi:MAG: DUF3515 domain-containing protein [Actinocrinis sp.]
MKSQQEADEDGYEALAEGAEYSDEEYEDDAEDGAAQDDGLDEPDSVEDEATAQARRTERRHFTLLVGAALGLTALTAGAVWLLFHSDNAVAVAVPQVASKTAQAQCAALTKDVPQTVDGQGSRSTSPRSPLTAAWGKPAITLRCGVPVPEILRPGSKTYDPSADEAYLNGVAWLIEKTDSGYTFTAAQRAVYIEVDVPSAYSPETNPLIDLSAAVVKAVPRNDGGSGNDIEPLASSESATPSAPSTSATPAP